MSKRTGREISCEICRKLFYVPRCRLHIAKYCSMMCAAPGRARNAAPWAKGKTKATDSRLARIANCVRQSYIDNPERGRGVNHPAFGKPFSEEHLEKLRRSQGARPSSSFNTVGFDKGRDYFRGQTKETNPSIARRAKLLSQKYKGRANPAHSARMVEYYHQFPEKHPNRILCAKGHETNIERAMREALTALNIRFEPQHRIGRYFVDFAILGHRIAIEVDGDYWHNSRADEDRRRDADIAARGWRVMRFSEDQVCNQLDHCLNQILTHL